MTKARKDKSLIPVERIEHAIYVIRGQRVMLDFDLAALYGVTVKRLNQQVQRNLDRFPEDFAFPLTRQEFTSLKLQIATSNKGRGGRRYVPWAFTENGAVMLASVLNSPVAVSASLYVVRAFVRLRQLLGSHADLARKIAELEAKYDTQFAAVFEAIRQLMEPPPTETRRIGFETEHLAKGAPRRRGG